MEIYIILVIMESFLQCNYLCMVQCVYYGQNKEDALWLIILSIQIYFLSFPPSSSLFCFCFVLFKKNDTAELGGKAWVWCMAFEILMPRQKANTSHSMIIKYSHYSYYYFF